MNRVLQSICRVLAALVMLAPLGAHAEHEADHRYSIRGYVLDEAEQPLAGVRVSAMLAGQGTSGALTDAEGFYTINLHLHDADIGRQLQLRAGDVQATIRMQAEHGDQHTARIHWASFVGNEFREDALGRFQMPGWGWVAIGVAAFVALLFAGVRLQRLMKRRARAAAEASQPASAASKARKRKRRKR